MDPTSNHVMDRWCVYQYMSPIWAPLSTTIFNILADLLALILKEQGVSKVLHYIDDFLTMASSHCQKCVNRI